LDFNTASRLLFPHPKKPKKAVLNQGGNKDFSTIWTSPTVSDLLNAVESVLSEKRAEHADLLRVLYEQDEPKQAAVEGGPFVKSALWIERKLRDLLRLR
jgi:Ni,Fe-hydrogenase III component G